MYFLKNKKTQKFSDKLSQTVIYLKPCEVAELFANIVGFEINSSVYLEMDG